MKNKKRQKLIVPFLMVLFLVGSSFTTVKIKWEHLGSRTVNYKIDRDVIKVTAKDGAFKKLKVKVTNGSINMHRIVVQYGNGEKQVIQVKKNFKKGGATRIIDLKGNKRIIRDITFFYDTKNLSKNRAKVHVFGKH
ncbi:DUF2541 family protein [Aquimarina sp. MMG015]|uniref:DUF2541 family protein n=1 Tax=Aquimarina TaxID=290174 RepID=UPI00040E1EF7|nr:MULTISPECIES: DUF2541 family protein [Aquimarina]AXT55075.1 DUF2541 family protein [Aquimarina sp. AD1]MBQ4802033.1 DUF2541 family protein [Aquimarina sp. MMG015]RKN25532.1 DUF2541 family protein [Aquimarina sp. AD1]